VSYCTGDAEGRGLLGRDEAEEFLEELLYDENFLLIGHNIAYDLAVVAARWPRFLPQIFRAYEQGRISDTMIRQKLLDNSIGRFRGYKVPKKNPKKDENPFVWIGYGYNLDDCNFRATKKRLDKDTWRLRYGELAATPVDQWPEGAQKYAVDDAIAAWDVFWWQVEVDKRIRNKFGTIKTYVTDARPLEDEQRQVMSAWWIHLMKVWGIKTDPRRIHQLSKEIDKAYEELEAGLKEVGLVKSNGVRDTKAAKARMERVMGGKDKCRVTDKGNIQLDEDSCNASGDNILMDYAALSSLKAVKSKDLPALASGSLMPIHSNFDSLIATGRTSSSKPNVQNIRRLPGIRECFVPRPGMVFLDADYDGLELRTLAQVCLKMLGRSRLAEDLNAGNDPHTRVASEVLGISYAEAKRRLDDENDEKAFEARQLGKCANFGFPGGLGIDNFIYFAKKVYGVKLTEDQARRLKSNWMRAYPEMETYFAMISNFCQEDALEGTAFVKHIFSNRIRGGVPYTVACNSFFQGLGGDATKAAGWLIAKACYIEKDSPLYGCRMVNFIHDQFILECPEERAHEAAMELARLMVLGASKFLPDVPPTVSKPIVTRCWSKKAKQVWENGRLAPWDMKFSVKQRDRRASA
jgi:DNA polymerase-1